MEKKRWTKKRDENKIKQEMRLEKKKKQNEMRCDKNWREKIKRQNENLFKT